ncbi:hypothetical protein Ga0080574_TMP4330 [Salipiger abyssi]|uniref:Uncharacterized protein n=1 Tax=Salipiger abyssi TaxID=1250539 RepID=A0A1P8UZ39_9RHOB|nr:hypothetical protein Ga0080574_TMP4330 [Salipiger abyssi]
MQGQRYPKQPSDTPAAVMRYLDVRSVCPRRASLYLVVCRPARTNWRKIRLRVNGFFGGDPVYFVLTYQVHTRAMAYPRFIHMTPACAASHGPKGKPPVSAQVIHSCS